MLTYFLLRQDRRKVYAKLKSAGIELPRYAVLDRDSPDPNRKSRSVLCQARYCRNECSCIVLMPQFVFCAFTNIQRNVLVFIYLYLRVTCRARSVYVKHQVWWLLFPVSGFVSVTIKLGLTMWSNIACSVSKFTLLEICVFLLLVV